MRRWSLTMALLLALLGCQKEVELPPVPPAPEDLSTWSVPALVQPPPVPEPLPSASKEKPTAAEQVLEFQPGTTYTLQVPINTPLDLLLGPGEQVRNIIGGDRETVEASQATDGSQTGRWQVK